MKHIRTFRTSDDYLTTDKDREGQPAHRCAGCRKEIEGDQPYCTDCYVYAPFRPTKRKPRKESK